MLPVSLDVALKVNDDAVSAKTVTPDSVGAVVSASAVVLKATLVALDTRLPASSSATTQTVYAVDSLRLGVGETTKDWATFAKTMVGLLPFAAEPDTVPALIAEADGAGTSARSSATKWNLAAVDRPIIAAAAMVTESPTW